MRPFRLACVLLFAAGGCGRLGFDGGSGGPDQPTSNGIVPGTGLRTPAPEVNHTPYVCATKQFGGVVLDGGDLDVDLSVVPTATGATVLWVPVAGGALKGFETDAQLVLQGNAAGTTIRAGTFTASAGAYVDGSLIAAVVSNTRTIVHLVPSGLGSYTQIGNVDGPQVSKTPALHAGADRITPTTSSCTDGLQVTPYDNAWTAQATLYGTPESTLTSLDATTVENVAFTMWSNAQAGCNIEQLTDKANRTSSSDAMPCPNPRLVALGTEVGLVFENPAGAGIVHAPKESLAASGAVLLDPNSSAPRIAYDGSKVWTSFLDARGELTVGYLDGAGMLQATPLGVRPSGHAHELTYTNGGLWVLSVDSTLGFAAQRICAD